MNHPKSSIFHPASEYFFLSQRRQAAKSHPEPVEGSTQSSQRYIELHRETEPQTKPQPYDISKNYNKQ